MISDTLRLDDAVANILSRLPAIEAVRTSILSSEWRYKWTSIYVIDIQSPLGRRVEEIVEGMITGIKGDIQKFRLSYLGNHRLDDARIVKSIKNLSKRRLESLEISANLSGIHFTHNLFNSVSLKLLKLDIPASLAVSTSTWSTNLTDLTLSKISIVRQCTTHYVVFNFMSLKNLTLEECYMVNFKDLHFRCPALRRMDVKYYCNPSQMEDTRISFFGAKLEMFTYTGWGIVDIDLYWSEVFCMSVSSLTVESSVRAAYLLLERSAKSLSRLKIDARIVEAIHRAERLSFPTMETLRHLELTSSCENEAFLKFLGATPRIEEMELYMMKWGDGFDFNEVESVPTCIVSHLKEVKFNAFHGYRGQVCLADFFLKHAVCLKRMIGLSRTGIGEHNFWDSLKRVSETGDLEVKYYSW